MSDEKIAMSKKTFEMIVTEFKQSIGYSISALEDLVHAGHMPRRNLKTLQKLRDRLAEVETHDVKDIRTIEKAG